MENKKNKKSIYFILRHGSYPLSDEVPGLHFALPTTRKKHWHFEVSVPIQFFYLFEIHLISRSTHLNIYHIYPKLRIVETSDIAFIILIKALNI